MATISSENKRNFTYIAFFDLDRTLTGKTSGRALAGRAYRNGLMNHATFARAILTSVLYKLRLRKPAKIIDSMAGWTKGMTEEAYLALCSEVLEKDLLPSIFAEARIEIEQHRNKGARLVLLSSALGPVCRKIAADIKLDDVICTDLEVSGKVLTGKAESGVCFGPVKAEKLKEYCHAHSSTPSESWYYGDSISDLAVLSVVGCPVCVNPDSRLRRKASRNNWKIVNWQTIS